MNHGLTLTTVPICSGSMRRQAVEGKPRAERVPDGLYSVRYNPNPYSVSLCIKSGDHTVRLLCFCHDNELQMSPDKCFTTYSTIKLPTNILR